MQPAHARTLAVALADEAELRAGERFCPPTWIVATFPAAGIVLETGRQGARDAFLYAFDLLELDGRICAPSPGTIAERSGAATHRR